MASAPVFAAPTVHPQPVPTEIVVAQANIGGQRVVGMQINLPTGITIIFLDCDQARSVANNLLEHSGQIVLPKMG